jgi:hypothetical protein
VPTSLYGSVADLGGIVIAGSYANSAPFNCFARYTAGGKIAVSSVGTEQQSFEVLKEKHWLIEESENSCKGDRNLNVE